MPDVLVRSLRSLTRLLTTGHETDAALLARYASANDPTAFTELVRRHGPMVLGVCRRMLGHVHDADDAFQATFLIFARGARSVRKPDALPAWLYGTAVRVCRKARDKRGASAPVPDQAALGPDPFAEVAWKELRGLLDEELTRLPDALREPLLLCYVNGLTRDEAAEKLGWSRRTLMRRLDQARERLRLRLERRGVATLGLGAAVLVPRGMAAALPDRLVRAAVGMGTGGPVPAGVRVLAGAAAVKLLPVVAGLSLLLIGAGLGVAALAPQPTTDSPTPSSPPPAAASLDDRGPELRGQAQPLDADGRSLPDGAVHRLGSRRFRVEGRSDFILPSPDGRYVLVHPQPSLSAYAAQGLMLLDADTGLRVRSFEDSRRVPKGQRYDAIRQAAFSPDGKKLYALGWDKAEEKGDGFYVWAHIDNPCKRVLLVWDVETGKLTAEWALPSGGFFGASLVGINVSPDGKRLYVYGAVRMQINLDRHLRAVPGVQVLDAATGLRLQTWEGAGYPGGFTAGGKEVITFRRDAAITAHDSETGKVVRTFKMDGFISGIALSPDAETVAAVAMTGHPDKTTTGEIKLWETATGREIRKVTVDAKAVRNWSARLDFSADGKALYLGTGSGRILRWDLATGEELPEWSAHSGVVADLFRRPGKNELVSAGVSDGAVRRWDTATGKLLSTTDAYVGPIAVARTPDGRGMAAVDAAGRLDVWDLTTGRIAKTLQTPGRNRHKLLFTPDGKQLLLAAEFGPSTIWDWPAGKQVGEFSPPPKLDAKADESYWGTLGFSPDGRWLAACKFGRGTWVWTWPEKAVLWREAKEQECCFAPDGETLVCGDWHSPIEVRAARTGALKQSIPAPGMTDIAFSPDRRRMVTAHLDGAWRVRDAATGEALKEVKGFQHVWSVAFSPSGWLLAVAGDNSVRVHDTASWQEVARFDGHDGTVRTLFFGADDATLVSASSEDGTALVWSLKPSAGDAPEPAKLWADLSGDGPAVRRAVWAAAQHPDVAVKLFREKWPVPDRPLDVERARKLIGDLDNETFEVRESAEAGLVKLGRPAEAELRKALAESTSAEVKRRLEKILDRWSPHTAAEHPATEARELRAVWALELAGTPEAKKLLEAWAAAKVGNRLSEAAAAALKRSPQKP
jgi:RNA polymerase sigma factor (sigma-70 family)